MKLSKRQKRFLLSLLNRTYMPACCEGDFEGEGTALPYPRSKEEDKEAEKRFKERYGFSRRIGERYWKHFLTELQKDITR